MVTFRFLKLNKIKELQTLVTMKRSILLGKLRVSIQDVNSDQ